MFKRLPIPIAAALLFQVQGAIAQEGIGHAEEAAPEATEQSENAQSSITLPVSPRSSEEPPAASEQTGSRMIQEIVVTAQKREENLQDVPISIAAFSADTLDAKGVTDPKDLNTTIPAFQFGNTEGFTTIYIRGIGSDAFLFADPSVSLYIDGIYFPFSHGAAQAFGSIERIEILKGPQGTLFGRNATGGAINVVTGSPTHEFSTSIETSYATFDQSHTKININIPLMHSLSVALSGLYNTEDTFLEHATAAGQPLPRETTRGARIKVKWSPLDNLDVMISGFTLHQLGSAATFLANAKPSPLGRALGIEPAPHYGGNLDEPVFIDFKNHVFYQQTDLRTDWFDTKLLASYQKTADAQATDFDGSSKPLVSLSTPKIYANVTTAEFQILSNKNSWAANWLQWIGGAYYFKSTQGYSELQLYAAGADLANGRIAGIQLPTAFVDALNTAFPGSVPLPSGRLSLVPVAGTDSLAAFAQSTIHFADWIDLTLGGRYQDEKRRVIEANVGLANLDGTRTELVNYPHNSAEFKTFKPKVSLSLHPADDVLAYLSWQMATKSGAFNVVTITKPPTAVKAEDLTAIEAGVKVDFLNHLVRFNAAVFNNEIHNLQVQFVSLLNGGVVSFENAPRARVRGMDFDIVAQILPDTIEDLIVTFSGAYLDGKYTTYPKGSGYDENNLGIYSGNLDFTGNRTVRTPKFSATLGVSKTFEMEHGALEVASDLYYNSGFFYTAQNSSEAEQKSYNVVNARISYLYKPWDVRLTAYGQNLGKTYYTNGVLQTDFGTLESPAPPLNYGVRAAWTF